MRRVISSVGVLGRMLQGFLTPLLNVESESGDSGEDQRSGKMPWVSLAIADPTAS